MFRTAELGHKVSKEEYKQREPLLRQELLAAQQELRIRRDFTVIIVFAGVDGGGKQQTVNLLNEWMDPRWIVTRAYGPSSDEERERPEYWRFWRDLPPRGQIGLFLRSWYSKPLLERVYQRVDFATFNNYLERIVAFESALADDGAVILKFWMHLSRESQRKRLESLERDPLTRWQIKNTSWEHWRLYDRFIETAERIIMRTNTDKAPVTIVEGVDPNYRSLVVGTRIRDAIRKRLDEVKPSSKKMPTSITTPIPSQSPPLPIFPESSHPVIPEKTALPIEHNADTSSDTTLVNTLHATFDPVTNICTITNAPSPTNALSNQPPHTPLNTLTSLTVFSQLDMTHNLDKTTYFDELKKYQARLHQLHHQALERKVSTLVIFEGPDAAGKGSTIRRITATLEASNYQVIPFAAPTDEEREHHYLWRFWRHLSRAGRVTIYDRSWYGRVLVERVEGFASETEWRRAYKEINDFEEQLTDHGIVLLKFWLHITKDEQLRRFYERSTIPHKRWKLTDEDWRNREKWELYEQAAHDMVQYTSTRIAPWILVEGNDKRFARIKVLKQVCKQLAAALAVQ